MGKPLILAVDDELPILGIIRLALETAGFCVLTAATGRDAIELERANDPDAVLLDLMLPDIPGAEVMHEMRARRDVPVVVITADVTAGPAGLPEPDVEYLVKPFEPDELVETIRGLLENPAGTASRAMLQADGLEIDPAKGVAVRDGIIVPLSSAERNLLRILASRPGHTVASQELLARTWGEDYRDDDDYLALWISRLRQKVEGDPAEHHLIVQEGNGYRLEVRSG